MIEEIWKDIEGYEGLYQVSTLGNVRSKHSGKWKLLKATINQYGYRQFGLHKNGKQKPDRGHRLVAKAFIPNPDNLPFINHKDENKANDHVDNLEWCTPKYNVNYGTGMQRAAMNNPRQRGVCMFSEDGILIKEFRNLVRAAEYVNGDHVGVIQSCDGTIFSYKGYLWRYKEEQDTIYDIVKKYRDCSCRKKKVKLSNKRETVLCKSISEAARIVGVSNFTIRKHNQLGEYKWEIIE